MTIIVEIRPEVQAELARQVASHGSALEPYTASLLEEAVHFPTDMPTNGDKRNPEGRNLVEVCAMVKGLTADLDFSRNPSTDRPVEL